MWPVSKRFRDALTRDHDLAVQVDLLANGDKTLDLTALGVVADGTIQVDDADVQRSGTITLLDPEGELTPGTALDPLAPFGNELRVWRGVDFKDGTVETPPVATLRFVTTNVQRGVIQLQTYDRAWTLAGAHLETSLTLAAGMNLVDAVEEILASAAPAPFVPSNFPDTDEVIPRITLDTDADPWQAAREMAGNLGMRLFFDPMGVATMIPEPDPSLLQPVWFFDETDSRNISLPGTQDSWDGTGINAVIVIGENATGTETPVRGAAYDNDPASPTQYGGRFGKRPMIINDTKINTQAQADARALQELRARLGSARITTVPSVVNSALGIGDVIQVTAAAVGVAQLRIVQRFPVPLRHSGTMDIEARTQQVITT